jgi:hypothetical protein
MKEHHALDGRAWGTTGWRYTGEWFKNILRKNIEIRTILDFGAGQCTLGRGICEQFGNLLWVDYDPGVAGIDVLPDSAFDAVVSSDCLEHVEPPMLYDTLREIAVRARHIIALDIPNEGTGGTLRSGPYKGHDEHLIIKPADWWRDKCTDAFKEFTLESFDDRAVMLKGRPRLRTRMLWRRHGSW